MEVTDFFYFARQTENSFVLKTSQGRVMIYGVDGGRGSKIVTLLQKYRLTNVPVSKLKLKF